MGRDYFLEICSSETSLIVPCALLRYYFLDHAGKKISNQTSLF